MSWKVKNLGSFGQHLVKLHLWHLFDSVVSGTVLCSTLYVHVIACTEEYSVMSQHSTAAIAAIILTL